MRILNITSRFPYPVISGAPLRTYNVLKRIAREHEVYLLSFTETPEQVAGIEHMRTLCRAVQTVPLRPASALGRPLDAARFLLKGIPPDLRTFYDPAMWERIARLTARVAFDVVQLEHSQVAFYLEALPKALRSRAVLLFHDLDFSKYQQMLALEPRRSRRLRFWLHGRLMQRWEPSYAAHFARCVTVSEAERRALLAANPRLQVEVSPNGVDTQAYQMLPESDVDGPALLFVGNMGYRPNIDAMAYFCGEVLPRIRQAIPGVELWIVGINADAEVQRLAGNGVQVTGRVEDVTPYYRRCAACVVPLRAGSGTRLKIMEAMALGRPVVSTSIGCDGLDVVDGEHLLIADDPEGFAAQTLRVLTDRPLRQALTHNARQQVVSRYDWEIVAQGLVEIYRQVAGISAERQAAYV